MSLKIDKNIRNKRIKDMENLYSLIMTGNEKNKENIYQIIKNNKMLKKH